MKPEEDFLSYHVLSTGSVSNQTTQALQIEETDLTLLPSYNKQSNGVLFHHVNHKL